MNGRLSHLMKVGPFLEEPSYVELGLGLAIAQFHDLKSRTYFNNYSNEMQEGRDLERMAMRYVALQDLPPTQPDLTPNLKSFPLGRVYLKCVQIWSWGCINFCHM